MKSHRITFAVISLLSLLALTPVVFRFNLAHAQIDASSTDSSTTSQPATTDASSPAASSTRVASSSTSHTTTTAAATGETTAPGTFTLVHIVGTKYIDYCSDGSKVTSYPGDPQIDAPFDVPNTSTPNCPDGQTWVHTSGMPKYDTADGDLDLGDYAQQSDGSYITHYPATTYADATSTSNWPDRFVISADRPVSGSSSNNSQLDTATTSPLQQATASSTQ